MNMFSAQIPQQLSAAGGQQFEAQLRLLRSATGTAFDGAEKLMALQFEATRATMENSANLLRQVAAAKDPRDLLALAGQGKSQLDSVLAFQRQFFSVASAIGSSLAGLQAPVTATASAALDKLAALPAVADSAAPVHAVHATHAADVSVELIDAASAPVADAASELRDAVPIATLTAVAAATGHVDAQPSAAPVDGPADVPVDALVDVPVATPVGIKAASPAPGAKAGGRSKKK